MPRPSYISHSTNQTNEIPDIDIYCKSPKSITYLKETNRQIRRIADHLRPTVQQIYRISPRSLLFPTVFEEDIHIKESRGANTSDSKIPVVSC